MRAGTGLLAAVEIAGNARSADPGIGARLAAEVRDRGVITRLVRGVAPQVSPPFIITEQQIEQIADTFAAALEPSARREISIYGGSDRDGPC